MKKLAKRAPIGTGLLLSLFLFLATGKNVQAQSHGLVGVDHVGMNVPDMDSAVKFFTDVMGCVPVTTIGHLPMDAAWKKKYKIHPHSELERIVSLRAGNGSNIELFQYQSTEANKEQPYNDDMGLNHIAFYTTDMPETVAFLKTKGINVLNDPIKNMAGPTAGETWVYFLTPWGAKIELISYPDGKAYEKTSPAVKLWSPKDAEAPLKITEMPAAQINAIVEKHLEIWNAKESQQRTDAIKEVYNDQLVFVSPGFESVGNDKLNKFIDDLHANNAGYVFTHQRPIESHHNLARLFWSFGPPSHPDAITGMDLFIIENDRVQSLYVFLNAPGK
ncbi:Catechol 2,3-dioxygenase [Mucilaginibacter lappiensis]|uniref:Catechol 2,3-dioxygenase-like lactoylglutathione lyase family enzyme n=1 Tax=Mucilaginibacter lappiensis TaxID=354630 RepID=A0ABR6PDS7_9SPHI|nr:VOC family protein [Mucilaginibacter lappiensis]MBB6107773.1 catechol 2,3-dioxygenase-like lactoylglutathione lyase family enzyme [Mucilaginibacter lappiensis]SIP97623.1 Catechol 2,3-dioxygenase [Mucilaginibacter lappiensis]